MAERVEGAAAGRAACRRGLLLLLLVLLVAVPAAADGDAGNGSDGDGGDADEASPTGNDTASADGNGTPGGNATAPGGASHGTSYGEDTFPATLLDGQISPHALTIQVGDVVEFRNAGEATHALAIQGRDVYSGDIGPEAVWSWESTDPGVFVFLCQYHEGLRGDVIVVEREEGNAPPFVRIDAPVPGDEVAGRVDVSGTVGDPDGDNVHVLVRFGNQPWRNAIVTEDGRWVAAWDSTSVPNGEYAIEAVAQDAHGAWSTFQVVYVTVLNGVDPEVREYDVTIGAPTDSSTLRGTVTVQGWSTFPADPARVPEDAEVRVRVGNGPWLTANGTFSWTLRLDTLAYRDGVHVIQAAAYAHGDLGPITQVSARFSNDDEAPITVTITSPAERSKVSGVAELRGVVSDSLNEAPQVYVRIDQGEWREASGLNPWRYSWDTRSLTDGPHLVEVKAATEDRSSRVQEITLITENGEDRRRPEVHIDHPARNSEVNGTITIRGTAVNPSEHPLTVQFRVNGGPWQGVSGTLGWGYTLDTTAYPNGVHHLEARAFTTQAYSDDVRVPIRIVNADEADEDAGTVPLTPSTGSGTPAWETDEVESEDSRFLDVPGPALALAAGVLAVAAWASAWRARSRRP